MHDQDARYALRLVSAHCSHGSHDAKCEDAATDERPFDELTFAFDGQGESVSNGHPCPVFEHVHSPWADSSIKSRGARRVALSIPLGFGLPVVAAEKRSICLLSSFIKEAGRLRIEPVKAFLRFDNELYLKHRALLI